MASHNCGSCRLCLTPFHALKRRHHCRACGRSVCGSCSPHFVPLPSRGYSRAVRHCTQCLETLSTTAAPRQRHDWHTAYGAAYAIAHHLSMAAAAAVPASPAGAAASNVACGESATAHMTDLDFLTHRSMPVREALSASSSRCSSPASSLDYLDVEAVAAAHAEEVVPAPEAGAAQAPEAGAAQAPEAGAVPAPEAESGEEAANEEEGEEGAMLSDGSAPPSVPPSRPPSRLTSATPPAPSRPPSVPPSVPPARSVRHTFPSAAPLGMFFEQADGYVVVQRVIPTLQAHEVGVRAGWVVRGIDHGDERINLAGMSRDEIIGQIEASPRPFVLTMALPASSRAPPPASPIAPPIVAAPMPTPLPALRLDCTVHPAVPLLTLPSMSAMASWRAASAAAAVGAAGVVDAAGVPQLVRKLTYPVEVGFAPQEGSSPLPPAVLRRLRGWGVGVTRKYTDFWRLHQTLCAEGYPSQILPRFPGWLQLLPRADEDTESVDDVALARRQAGLDVYLRALLQLPQLRASLAVKRFLCDDDEPLFGSGGARSGSPAAVSATASGGGGSGCSSGRGSGGGGRGGGGGGGLPLATLPYLAAKWPRLGHPPIFGHPPPTAGNNHPPEMLALPTVAAWVRYRAEHRYVTRTLQQLTRKEARARGRYEDGGGLQAVGLM